MTERFDVSMARVLVSLEHGELERFGPLPIMKLDLLTADGLDNPVKMLWAVWAMGPQTDVGLLRSEEIVDDLRGLPHQSCELLHFGFGELGDTNDVTSGSKYQGSEPERSDAVVHHPEVGPYENAA